MRSLTSSSEESSSILSATSSAGFSSLSLFLPILKVCVEILNVGVVGLGKFEAAV